MDVTANRALQMKYEYLVPVVLVYRSTGTGAVPVPVGEFVVSKSNGVPNGGGRGARRATRHPQMSTAL